MFTIVKPWPISQDMQASGIEVNCYTIAMFQGGALTYMPIKFFFLKKAQVFKLSKKKSSTEHTSQSFLRPIHLISSSYLCLFWNLSTSRSNSWFFLSSSFSLYRRGGMHMSLAMTVLDSRLLLCRQLSLLI